MNKIIWMTLFTLLLFVTLGAQTARQKIYYSKLEADSLASLINSGTGLIDKDLVGTKLFTHLLGRDDPAGWVGRIKQAGTSHTREDILACLNEILNSKHKNDSRLYLETASCSAESLQDLPGTTEFLMSAFKMRLDSETILALFRSELMLGRASAPQLMDLLLDWMNSKADWELVKCLSAKTDLLSAYPGEKEDFLQRIMYKSDNTFLSGVPLEEWEQLIAQADVTRIQNYSPYFESLYSYTLKNRQLLLAFIQAGADIYQQSEDESFFFKLLGLDGSYDLLEAAVASRGPAPDESLNGCFDKLSFNNAKDDRYWRLLVDMGADIYEQGEYYTPIQTLFMRENSLELLNSILSRYPFPAQYPINGLWMHLMSSPNKDKLDYYKLLIAQGADVFADYSSGMPYLMMLCNTLPAATLDGIFALLPSFDINELFERYFYAWMAFIQDIDKLKLAIKWGADLLATDPQAGITPLSMACYTAYNPAPGAVKLLLDSGADVNHRLKYGPNILTLAAQNGEPETVQLLLDYGADGSYKDTTGKTAYDVAGFKIKRHPVYAELEKARFGASEREFKVMPVSTKRFPDAIALVIGIRDYQDPQIPKVDYALQDAQMMKRLYIETYGIPEANVFYLENASLARLTEYLGNEVTHKGRLFSLIRPGETDLFVYYSGHGAPVSETNTGYFVPSDCNPSLLEISGYSLDTFYRNLGKLQARYLNVVIDACFSGSSAAGMLIKNASPIYIKLSKQEALGENATLLTSAKENEISSWYPEKAHSLFTYYYLKGLQGEADVDQNRRITSREMGDWLNAQVGSTAMKLYNRSQTPSVLAGDSTVLLEY